MLRTFSAILAMVFINSTSTLNALAENNTIALPQVSDAFIQNHSEDLHRCLVKGVGRLIMTLKVSVLSICYGSNGTSAGAWAAIIFEDSGTVLRLPDASIGFGVVGKCIVYNPDLTSIISDMEIEPAEERNFFVFDEEKGVIIHVRQDVRQRLVKPPVC